MPPETESVPTTVLDCSGVGSGGITRVLTEVVRYWPAGHRLEVVAAPEGWDPPSGAAAVKVLGRQSGGRARTITSAAAALRRATTARGPAESVRVLSMSPSLAVAGSRLPVTTVVHDLAFRLWPRDLSTAVRQYRRLSYATAIRRSERLICVSARTRHDLYGVYGVAPERTAVWHLGSDLDAAPGTLPAALGGGPYLVVAGHAAHKGVELAIAALPGLAGRTLAVLTGGRPVPEWTAAAQRHGVADRVVFLPRIDDDAYTALVARAEAFLMPSHFEGYGLPAVEALRLGTPTVVSPDPALLEATAGAAVRMTTWTAAALVDAVATATAVRGAPAPELRSWQQATADLVSLLDGTAAAARLPRQRRAGELPVPDHG